MWSEDVDVGVDGGHALQRFARAACGRDAGAIAEAVVPVRAELGDLALCRAAGVAAFFDAINRVADAIGVELDDHVMVPDDLDVDRIRRLRAAAQADAEDRAHFRSDSRNSSSRRSARNTLSSD